MWYIWLIISGLAIIIEFFTVGFLIFWFSIGALIAMIVSFFTDNVFIQTSVFIISSTLLIFATKPFVEKITKNDVTIKTNVRSIEGKVGKVTHTIEPLDNKGQVKVNGEIWSAKTEDNSKIEKGTQVEILKIDGVKLIVKPISTKILI